MKGMTLPAIAAACKGELYGYDGNLKEVQGVELDSRKLQEGYLFIAAKGERVDGHSFIPQALEKGCLGVVCETLPKEIMGTCILVKDSFLALADIAAYYREQLDIPVVGITGSVGKTSTKEVIASVLSQKYCVHKTEGNYNNEIGLPLTVLKLREEHEVAVLEMGINHFGEMHRLSRVAKPDICVITNIGQCHLEYLIDRDGILRAKTEIFDFMNPNGTAILNGDDDKLVTVTQVYGKRPQFFGKGNTCDVRPKSVRSLGLDGMEMVAAQRDGEEYHVRLHVPGEHMVFNALAAILTARTLGLTTLEIQRGLESASTVTGRSNIIKENDLTIIDDCYNANPVSMKAAIALLETAKGRRVAILGDMFELGAQEKQLHYEVGSVLAQSEIEVVLCVGELAKEMYLAIQNTSKECAWFADKKELTEKLSQLIHKNDVILLKASHGMGFHELLTKLSILHFPDTWTES